MREFDDLDLLLGSALSTYADPGANSGFEQRILTRVFSAGISVQSAPTPRLRWLPWAIALPAAACLLLLAVISVPKKAIQPTAHAFQAHGSQTPLIASASTESQPAPHLKTAQGAMTSAHKVEVRSPQAIDTAAPFPKLDVFPTPQPLTPEEQALTVFAIRTPALELQALIEAQKQDNAPLSITAIYIQPLDPPGQGGN